MWKREIAYGYCYLQHRVMSHGHMTIVPHYGTPLYVPFIVRPHTYRLRIAVSRTMAWLGSDEVSHVLTCFPFLLVQWLNDDLQ